MQTFTLFVSTPGDVHDEHRALGGIVERLQARYWNLVRIEMCRAERPAAPATAGERSIGPGDCDLFLGLLGSSPLPRLDRQGAGGDLEEALGAATATRNPAEARPGVLVYHRRGDAGGAPQVDAFLARFSPGPDPFPARVFSSYTTIDEFADLCEQHVERFLRRQLRPRRGPAAARPRPLEGSPFRGRGSFDYEDASLFFGRNRAIAAALDQLKANRAAGQAFLLIHGGSGCGKSSLMRAGLAPRLTADGYLPEVGAWCGTTVLPVEDGAPPLATLARAIVGALPELAKLRDSRKAAAPAKRKSRRAPTAGPVWDGARLTRALGDPEQRVFAIAAIVAALDRLSAARPAHFLLLVDQLEEIFTGGELPAAARDAYFHVLAAFAKSRRIWVVATLRSEFSPRVRERFHGFGERGSYPLDPPDEADFLQIIRGPALAAGLRFERHPEHGGDLSERIARDASGLSDGLGRLGRTLEALHQRRKGGLLTWSAYEEIGGPTGSDAHGGESGSAARPGKPRLPRAAALLGVALVAGAAALGIASRHRNEAAAAGELARDTRRALAASYLASGAAPDAARDEALPYLLAALEQDPTHPDAQALLLTTLRDTAWNFPLLELRHPEPLRALSFGPDPDTLFAACNPPGGTPAPTLRWDLKKPAITGILALPPEASTSMLSVAPSGKRMIVRRTRRSAEDFLLCDAETMRIVTRLPVASGHPLPGSCFAWSPDGLLLAHPADPPPDSPEPSSYVWRIVDSTRGRSIRESDPSPAPRGAPLAAQLDVVRLRAVAADGSLLEMPLQPARLQRIAPATAPLDFALFSPDGNELLARRRAARSEPSTLQRYSIVPRPDGGGLDLEATGDSPAAGWTSSAPLLGRLPWTRGESAAQDGLDEPALPLLHPEDGRLVLREIDGSRQESRAPLRADSPILCAASFENRIAIGGSSGQLLVHEVLPRLGHGRPAAEAAAPAGGGDGWQAVARVATAQLQHREGRWRIREKSDGKATPLPPHPAWTRVNGADLSADGRRVVLAGEGPSSAGMVVCDPATGALLSALEPIPGIRGGGFLGDSHRVAAIGAREVIVADSSPDGFHRVATIPVAEVRSFHHVASRGWLALATPTAVHLVDARDFSRIARLPAAAVSRGNGGHDEVDGWAEDATRGWLACRRSGRLDLWSLASRHSLVSGLAVPVNAGRMSFAERDGMVGLAFEGGWFLPLARPAGLDPRTITALREFVAGVAGIRFATDPRSPDFPAAAARRDHALAADRDLLEPLLPGAGALLDRIHQLGGSKRGGGSPEVWIPLWERLARAHAADHARIATGAAALGSGHPWLQDYLRGRIAACDRRFYAGQQGEGPAEGKGTDPLPPQGDEVVHLHRLAGDGDEVLRLKQAAWRSRTKTPPTAGQAPADAILDARIAATRAAHDRQPGPAHAIAHAEALALRGRSAEAAEFLRDRVPADAVLNPEQAHFLLASGLSAACPQPLDRALETLGSPWLWSAWLVSAASPELAARVDRAMQAVDGRGPAAIAALHTALQAGDSAAIARALALAHDLPAPVRDYAAARALWAQGRPAEVFALWPGALPDYPALERSSDWGGWEAVLPRAGRDDFLAGLQRQLATLEAPPQAGVDELRALADRLLDPATTANFGTRRVRDAMVACGLVLAHDRDSTQRVATLLGRARLAGADPLDCLRIEARSRMAAGDYSAAYGRWLELVDPEVAGAVASDYLEAARCLLHDAQDAPAVELLLRGKGRFAADPVFAHEAAWLLLGAARPEEAGILLEHGFTLPFTPEQRATALAMLVCAAEQTGRGGRADQTFHELLAAAPDWGDAAALEALDWPPDLKRSLQEVAARQRGR